jgi:diguanylate cyclase (GGDEF)-like protein
LVSVQGGVGRAPGRRLVTIAVAVPVALALGFGLVLATEPFGETGMTAFTDLGQLAAAVLGGTGAALAALRAWRRERQRLATAWGLIAVGVWAWAWGEAIWSGYEVLLGEEVPFPSLADVGFLALPVLAGLGLLVWPVGVVGVRERLLAAVDGALVAASLLVLSWATSLGATIGAGGQDRTGVIIAAAYPIGDVVLAALVIVLLTRATPGNRMSLLLLSAGLVSLAVADSAFMYQTSSGSYVSGRWLDVGWFAGFLVIGVAGVVMGTSPTTLKERRAVVSWRRLALPYIAASLALLWIFVKLLRGGSLDLVETLSALVIIAAAWCRQLIAVAENSELVHALETREKDESLAFRDALTGLLSESPFEDHVEHARRRAQRDGLPRGVLVVDVDDFHKVKQALGDDAADQLLLEVAQRLRSSVRAGDSVGRLHGEDNFGVLLEAGHQGFDRVAQRVVERLRAVVPAGGEPVPISASVGLVQLEARSWRHGPADLLRAAEHAADQAKDAGKGRFVAVDVNAGQGESA